MIIFLVLSVFSVGVVLLEVLPSHKLFRTTFVATLETQALSARIGPISASIPGISGSRISLRDTKLVPPVNELSIIDLTQLYSEDATVEDGALIFLATSEKTHLELDNFVIPPGRVLEISAFGRDNYVSLGLTSEEPSALASATIVWNGDIAIKPEEGPATKSVGTRQWLASTPFVEIESADFLDPIYSPIRVMGLSTVRLKTVGNDQVAASALLGGDIRFYFGNQPGELIELKPGEFVTFTKLDALLTNLILTENGMQFILVGEATAVKTGYLTNLRDVTPNILAGISSIPSIMLILSAIFTLSLAVLSAINLRNNELE